MKMTIVKSERGKRVMTWVGWQFEFEMRTKELFLVKNFNRFGDKRQTKTQYFC